VGQHLDGDKARAGQQQGHATGQHDDQHLLALDGRASETVEARVREAGSDAVVHQVVPMLLTAVFCGGH